MQTTYAFFHFLLVFLLLILASVCVFFYFPRHCAPLFFFSLFAYSKRLERGVRLMKSFALDFSLWVVYFSRTSRIKCFSQQWIVSSRCNRDHLPQRFYLSLLHVRLLEEKWNKTIVKYNNHGYSDCFMEEFLPVTRSWPTLFVCVFFFIVIIVNGTKAYFITCES